MTVASTTNQNPSVLDRQWLWALLPAFPVVLLALRLWLLSRQNPQTMLLLVQHVSSLGLVSTLALTLIQWVLPAAILAVRALSALDAVSGSASSRLARAGERIPDWVVALAVLLAAVGWQLRFLPALLMVTLMIVGLRTRERHSQRPSASPRPSVVPIACVALPVAAAVAAYALLAPAIAQAFSAGEHLNALLFLLPPGMAVLLTGPVPAQAAQEVMRGAAIGAAVLAPFFVGAFFLKAPILPTVAMELDDPSLCAAPGEKPADGSVCVARGQVITVDDRVAAVLRNDGSVLFVPNDALRSQTLCATAEQAPTSTVTMRGWHIEQSVLDWTVPRSTPTQPDPRCEGRPLHPRED